MKPLIKREKIDKVVSKLRDTPRDLFVMPWGSYWRVDTKRYPGAIFIGSYTKAIAADDLYDDALHAAGMLG